MQALDHPKAPPLCCHICRRTPISKQPMKWVDTGKNFGLNFPRNIPLKGRVYVCERCAEQIGKAIGLVPLSLVARARAEMRRARALSNVFRVRFERLAGEISEAELENEAAFLSQADADDPEALDAELAEVLGETETEGTPNEGKDGAEATGEVQ